MSAAGPEALEPPLRRPNVLLIVTDDQGWGEIGLRGHPWLATPALDAMAAKGVSLDRFYAAAPVCSPTRASILTGRHPNRTRTFNWGHELPGEETTFAELLEQSGYRTGHFGKWHLGSMRAGHPTSPGAQGFTTWASSPNFFDLDPWLSVEGSIVETHGDGSDVITERALEFIRDADENAAPFLAVIWYGNPHLPHAAIEEDLAQQAAAPEDARAYYAELSAIDRNVARLRSELRTLGIERDTLTWFTSDNGPRAPGSAAGPSTGGLRGDKGTLWEGGIRVPCLIEYPGTIEAGMRIDMPTGTVDVFPTLLALVGIPVTNAERLDGINLLPQMTAQAPLVRASGLGFWTLPVPGRVMHAERMLELQAKGQTSPEELPPELDRDLLRREPLPGAAAWIDGHWKLHARPSGRSTSYTLYDLERDPAESRNVAQAEPQRLQTMRATLTAWQTSIVSEHLSGTSATEGHGGSHQ
jgi:arylsulfatase A-like enzyme